MRATWRQSANRAIREALEAGKAQGLEGAPLEKFVRANGYPFGERAMHPYKIWCSEVKRVLAMENRKPIPRYVFPSAAKPLPGQGELFE